MSLRSILTNLNGFCNPSPRTFTSQLDAPRGSKRKILRGLVHGRNMARRASNVVRDAGYDNNVSVVYDHCDDHRPDRINVLLEHTETSSDDRSGLYRAASDVLLPGRSLPRQVTAGDITFGVPAQAMQDVSPTYDIHQDLPVQLSFSSQTDLTPRRSYHTTGRFELGHNDIQQTSDYS